MLQQKQGDAQIFCHSFDVKVERWLASYAKLTMPISLISRLKLSKEMTRNPLGSESMPMHSTTLTRY
jgi:hypothetical protein